MIFRALAVEGAFVIELEPHRDERGFFARSFCASEFEKLGLDAKIVQENISNNTRRGTLRGIHYQAPGGTEAKTVRCVRGRIYDVVVDLRHGSKTFGTWASAELDEENKRALYIPAGCGHAFQTLSDDCDVHYAMSAAWEPDLSRGLRYDDAAFAIPWPLGSVVLSEADRAWPTFAQVFE
jgi:dTDP-4-dehydrorhamnose 3,5-epimerase